MLTAASWRNGPVATALWALVLSLVTACASVPNPDVPSTYQDDSVINAKVKTALIRSPDVSALSINVETYERVVQLSGFVESEEDKAEAAALAHEVDGVRSVINNLTVKPPDNEV